MGLVHETTLIRVPSSVFLNKIHQPQVLSRGTEEKGARVGTAPCARVVMVDQEKKTLACYGGVNGGCDQCCAGVKV